MKNQRLTVTLLVSTSGSETIKITELTCKPLAGVGTNQTIFILVGTQKSNEEKSFSYKPPKIEEFKYYTAPTHSNKIITITGENFIPIELISKDNSNSSVLIDNKKCEEIKWIDSTKVSCQVPVGQGKDLSIKIKIENQETEENQQFSYDRPFIQSINPSKGRCNQEVIITIQGDSFGKSDQLIKIGQNLGYSINTPKITIGSNNCLNINTISPNEVHCIVLKSSAGTKQFALTYESYQPTYSQFTHKNDDDSDSHNDDHKDNNGPKDTIIIIIGCAIAVASAATGGLIISIFGGVMKFLNKTRDSIKLYWRTSNEISFNCFRLCDPENNK
ncbi:hypothetical protein ACTFIZ_008386 [Dictyostelium cf. discoideum]